MHHHPPFLGRNLTERGGGYLVRALQFGKESLEQLQIVNYSGVAKSFLGSPMTRASGIEFGMQAHELVLIVGKLSELQHKARCELGCRD